MLDTEVQAREPIRRELQEAVSRFLDDGGEIQKTEIIKREILVTEVTRGKPRKRYSTEDEDTIRRMQAEGATITDIAKAIGRVRQSVSTKMRQMGISTAQPGAERFEERG